MIFVLEHQTRRTTIRSLFLFMFIKLQLVKMCPIFVGSQLSCLARYQKFFWGLSFRCKNLLSFTRITKKKFHNCHHVSYWGDKVRMGVQNLKIVVMSFMGNPIVVLSTGMSYGQRSSLSDSSSNQQSLVNSREKW